MRFVSRRIARARSQRRRHRHGPSVMFDVKRIEGATRLHWRRMREHSRTCDRKRDSKKPAGRLNTTDPMQIARRSSTFGLSLGCPRLPSEAGVSCIARACNPRDFIGTNKRASRDQLQGATRSPPDVPARVLHARINGWTDGCENTKGLRRPTCVADYG